MVCLYNIISILQVLSFCVLSLCVHSIAQYIESPCPAYFVYQQRNDSTDRWYGLFNLESKENVAGVELKLTLNNAALGLVNTFGPPITYDHKEYTIADKNYILSTDSSYLIRFYVNYDISKSVPELIQIKQNGKIICKENRRPLQIFSSTFVDLTNTSIAMLDDTVHNGDDEIQCGTIAAEARPPILNGELAEIGKYPWHATIYIYVKRYSEETLKPRCGGSLISKQHVVTAAHCLSAEEKFQIYLGTRNNDSTSTQIHEIAKYVIHPEFNPRERINDIALIKLKKSAEFNNFVRPVCLWEGDINFESIIGKAGTLVVWGTHNVLQVTAVSYNDCLEKHSTIYLSRNIFCAAARNASSCGSDGGGGMVFLIENSERKVYQLRGILSYGDLSCKVGSYDIYTDVATYLSFIKANLK